MKILMKLIKRLITCLFPSFLNDGQKLFVNENKKYWHLSTGKIGVLVEGSLSTPASILEKSVIAKTIANIIGRKVIVILPGFYPQTNNAYKIYKSFKIKDYIWWWSWYLKPVIMLKSFIFTLKVFKKYKNGNDLIALSIDGVHIGDLVYDTLIRFNPNSYTIDLVSFKLHFRLIFRAIFTYNSAVKIFTKYDIKAFVTSHNVYAEYGIFCRVAHKFGASVFLKDMDVFKVYSPNKSINEHFLKVSTRKLEASLDDYDLNEKADKYFHQRLNGFINQIDIKNAYGNKKIYNRHELCSLYGCQEDLKNILVMAHAFSDAPHVGGKLIYKDYYEWLEKTLKILSDVNGVNIFVKPHPSSYMWGEKSVVESIIEKFSLSKVFIVPLDFNTASAKHIADYIVTARGTAGLEYSGYGIPAIICGDGFYTGFGIAIESKTVPEYERNLLFIKDIQYLNAEIIKKSRLLLYLTFAELCRSSIAPDIPIYPSDDIRMLISKKYHEMTDKLIANGKYEDQFYFKVVAASKIEFN